MILRSWLVCLGSFSVCLVRLSCPAHRELLLSRRIFPFHIFSITTWWFNHYAEREIGIYDMVAISEWIKAPGFTSFVVHGGHPCRISKCNTHNGIARYTRRSFIVIPSLLLVLPVVCVYATCLWVRSLACFSCCCCFHTIKSSLPQCTVKPAMYIIACGVPCMYTSLSVFFPISIYFTAL